MILRTNSNFEITIELEKKNYCTNFYSYFEPDLVKKKKMYCFEFEK